jgi:hypothetical protein
MDQDPTNGRFLPGNTIQPAKCSTCGHAPPIKHRKTVMAEDVRNLFRKMIKVAPHLDRAVFGPALQAFCRIALVARNSYAWLQENDSFINEDGELKDSLEKIARINAMVIKAAKSLGLTPDSFSEFVHEFGVIDEATDARIRKAYQEHHKEPEEVKDNDTEVF